MKKALLISLLLFLCLLTKAQEDRRNVIQSDISSIYRNAVKRSYYKELNRNYNLSKGYHGMLDFGYSAGCGDYDIDRFEMNTSHGYQFNPYVFIGGGLGFHFMSEYYTYNDYLGKHNHRDNSVDIPIYFNGRLTFMETNITPFIDFRGGFFITHNGGTYMNISAGVRFATWSRQAVNLFVGYSYENLEFDTFKTFSSSHSMEQRYTQRFFINSVSIKIGYEF